MNPTSRRVWVLLLRRVSPGRAFLIAFAAGLAVIASAVAGVVVWNRMLSRLVRQRMSQLQQELAEGEKSKYALVRLNRQLRAICTFGITTLRIRVEHKETERRVLAGEQLFRALVENSPDFVARFDLDGHYTFANPANEKAFGIPAEAIIGKSLRELPPGRKPEQTDALLALIHREEDYSVCTGSEKTLAKVLVSLVDITGRKTAEEALRRLNLELDQRVLDRTAQLEAANREMHAFTYTVSHDLRAPLRHIDGFLELLQQKAGAVLDEQSWHYMDAISNAAQRMGMLIDDLLSFSRMGRHSMSFREMALEPLVRDVIREFEPDIAGREIIWRIGDLPAVRGDAAVLRMVFSNLISNALKFTRPRQNAQIEIGALPGQGAEATIFVRDNGVGFDMAYADKMFGVFQRLHRAEEFEGTGIGLANVRRIIARHGGQTRAEGKPNQGATFYFMLPRSMTMKG